MRAWVGCALLVTLCARVGWVERSNRQAVQLAALTAGTAVVLTLLR